MGVRKSRFEEQDRACIDVPTAASAEVSGRAAASATCRAAQPQLEQRGDDQEIMFEREAEAGADADQHG